MPSLPSRHPTQALAATAVALALVIAVQLVLPARSFAPAAADLPVDDSLPDFGSTPFDPPSMAELSETLDRPLFFPDRRLPVAPAAAEAPAEPLRLRLEGVAIVGDSRVALLRDTSNNQLLQLAEGMSHDGWVLDAVESGSARFVRGPEVTELPLESGQRR
jgi:hypothetical protein